MAGRTGLTHPESFPTCRECPSPVTCPKFCWVPSKICTVPWVRRSSDCRGRAGSGQGVGASASLRVPADPPVLTVQQGGVHPRTGRQGDGEQVAGSLVSGGLSCPERDGLPSRGAAKPSLSLEVERLQDRLSALSTKLDPLHRTRHAAVSRQ